MTIRHLRIFKAVCETGSTTAASEKLLIAQPSISVAISELETHYGIKLFDRIGKRLHITEAGKNFLQHTIHIVSMFDDMEKTVSNYDIHGMIRIGASITIGNYLLPCYIQEFSRKHPDMEVKVAIHNSDMIQSRIIDNTLDLGLIEEGLIRNQYIVSSHFHTDELVFICPNDHIFAGRSDIDISSFSDQKFILREIGSAGRGVFDGAMAANGITIEPSWESVSTQAIVRAVQTGLGISILPYLFVKESLENQEIQRFRVAGLSFDRKFSIIHHKNKFLTQSAKDFIALCNKGILQGIC